MVETLGEYKILDRIGAGGIGDVYRARDTRLGRTVALKIVRPEIAGDAATRERFVADARAAAVLSHPSIAALYEVAEDQGELFLAIEFVPGEPVHAEIAGRAMNPRRAIDLGVQLADALADGHAIGIVHGDLKPDNVFVTPKGRVKILDFGLAAWTHGGAERVRAAQQPTSSTLAAHHTIAYLSPEQAIGERGDHRTDIFSLGVMLFEMLTGRLPFEGGEALPLHIAQATAPAPSSVNPEVPRELDSIVQKALSKSLDQRSESAATLAAELRSVAAILDERATLAELHAAAAPNPRSRSRFPWLVVLFVVVVLAAVMGWLLLGR